LYQKKRQISLGGRRTLTIHPLCCPPPRCGARNRRRSGPTQQAVATNRAKPPTNPTMRGEASGRVLLPAGAEDDVEAAAATSAAAGGPGERSSSAATPATSSSTPLPAPLLASAAAICTSRRWGRDDIRDLPRRLLLPVPAPPTPPVAAERGKGAAEMREEKRIRGGGRPRCRCGGEMRNCLPCLAVVLMCCAALPCCDLFFLFFFFFLFLLTSILGILTRRDLVLIF
jgi:hypothetical protein